MYRLKSTSIHRIRTVETHLVIVKIKHIAKRALDRIAVATGRRLPSTQGLYIGARETVEAAERNGETVCDYVEKLWDIVGLTDNILNQLEQRGVFAEPIETVLEIGAGTGRFLEKTLERHEISRYESYELSKDWAQWLGGKYPIISQPCDGSRLNATPDGSIDVVVAYGVFVYLPFLTTCRYLDEVARVLKPGGRFAFDAYFENCFDEETLAKWVHSGHDYPVVLPRDMFVDLLQQRGLELTSYFPNPYGIGKTEYMVWIKRYAAKSTQAN
ncbi:class I SAM-dependent methyltransferase [Allorhodopirellula heiligendammensis]|uniref:Methyltransferase type 11 domain-containing protein n=1 Tax=Allorhodopirellula heiligendammensis TaxID=2714739 RepID=A0A5C6BWT5_9BACT|nr:class I SAM-dependent methyltransferase [Allorhodopirellula heiligendammensis]TWU16388.1 hypothetical protein Poly21_35930 [Allorhodopirellula heiligendammensis]